MDNTLLFIYYNDDRSADLLLRQHPFLIPCMEFIFGMVPLFAKPWLKKTKFPNKVLSNITVNMLVNIFPKCTVYNNGYHTPEGKSPHTAMV